MTKLDKLKARLLQKPNDFTFQELETLLLGLGMKKKRLEKPPDREKPLFIR